MEKFYGGGGRSNPDFIHKVRVKNGSNPSVSDMMEWCDAYPTGNHAYFKRYYVDHYVNKSWDSGYTIFQFEWEEPAIMFKLKFGCT
jgi:hypothetical protein